MPLFDVSLNNSGHQFKCSDKQSVLHSGLLSGLNLKYGCDGGNCGECLARLTSGDIQALKHSDFVMSQAQKQQGSFLMCCHAAVSNIEIEAVEHGSENEIAQQNVDAKVYKISKLSKNVLEVQLKTPRSKSLKFFSGQYVTLKLKSGLIRNKSLASCPCDGSKLSFHVQYVKGDEFSEYIFNNLKKNEWVNIDGPNGHFTLNDESQAPIVLVAYETGLASIKGLIEHCMALEKKQKIQLYHLHTPSCDHYLKNYCVALDDALDNFQYSLVCVKDSKIDHLNAVFQHIISEHESINEYEVYAALPTSFHQQAEHILRSEGLAKRQFKLDFLERL